MKESTLFKHKCSLSFCLHHFAKLRLKYYWYLTWIVYAWQICTVKHFPDLSQKWLSRTLGRESLAADLKFYCKGSWSETLPLLRAKTPLVAGEGFWPRCPWPPGLLKPHQCQGWVCPCPCPSPCDRTQAHAAKPTQKGWDESSGWQDGLVLFSVCSKLLSHCSSHYRVPPSFCLLFACLMPLQPVHNADMYLCLVMHFCAEQN